MNGSFLCFSAESRLAVHIQKWASADPVSMAFTVELEMSGF